MGVVFVAATVRVGDVNFGVCRTHNEPELKVGGCSGSSLAFSGIASSSEVRTFLAPDLHCRQQHQPRVWGLAGDRGPWHSNQSVDPLLGYGPDHSGGPAVAAVRSSRQGSN